LDELIDTFAEIPLSPGKRTPCFPLELYRTPVPVLIRSLVPDAAGTLVLLGTPALAAELLGAMVVRGPAGDLPSPPLIASCP